MARRGSCIGMATAKGIVVAQTRNGWYSIRQENGDVIKSRGIPDVAQSRGIPDVAEADAQTRLMPLYSRESALTRSQSAAARRCALVKELAQVDTPRVRAGQLRVVVASKSDTLTYEKLGEPGEQYELPRDELDTLISKSPHFRKAWNYVTSRDSSHLYGTTQETLHVIYMAVMMFPEEWKTVCEIPAGLANHVSEEQAYVGLAKHGILHRWAGYLYNHVRSCNEVERNGTKTGLVDVSLRKHSGHQEGVTWLFVIQHNPALPLRAEEKRMIHYFDTHGPRGMNATT